MLLIKTEIKITHLYLHIVALTTEVDDPEKCLTYDTYANPGSSQTVLIKKFFD